MDTQRPISQSIRCVSVISHIILHSLIYKYVKNAYTKPQHARMNMR